MASLQGPLLRLHRVCKSVALPACQDLKAELIGRVLVLFLRPFPIFVIERLPVVVDFLVNLYIPDLQIRVKHDKESENRASEDLVENEHDQ